MSTRSDVTADMGWYRFEAKTIDITVTDAAGDPVDLSALDLLWRVVRDQGSDIVYLSKTTTITVSGADNNIASIEIDPDTDYEDLGAGIWRHELWSLTDNLLLSFGDCYVLNASVPA